ncbi:MAG: DUF861 domain-containing protein [Sphingopyxis sp.]|nr:DUF861 domain-containing protein [Sphingopyxis sp.]
MAVTHFKTDAVAPEAFAPVADRVLTGTPQGETRNGYESADGTRLVGEWSCCAGSWRVSYSEWEYCRILDGRVRLTADNGHVTEAGPGDNLVIEPGFEGVWENLEMVRKIYVIDLAAGAEAEPE